MEDTGDDLRDPAACGEVRNPWISINEKQERGTVQFRVGHQILGAFGP